jgi:DNA-binding NtrC family response regulator
MNMSDDSKTVLFVDDDADVRKTAELLLRSAGYRYAGASDPGEAMSQLAAMQADVILLDLNFSRAQTSGEEGLTLLRDILRHDPHAVVIVVTGHSGLNIAVEALRTGARDFIMKPWNNARLLAAVDKAAAERRAADVSDAGPAILVGRSEALQRIKAMIDRCAALNVPVLVRGEPGTGKTLVANILHRQSGRATLVQADAATLTHEHLAELTNTTLLIENIERIPEGMGVALHAWLTRAPRHNSRLLSTTAHPHRDLGLDRGLAYALNTIDIEIPPLRERTKDILDLAEHFLRVTCRQHGLPTKSLAPKAQARLNAHGWTDNVHALRNVIERGAILSDNPVIGLDDLFLPPDETVSRRPGEKPTASARLSDAEKVMIEEALQRSNFNVSAAAVELGLTRPALYRRMSKYGL